MFQMRNGTDREFLRGLYLMFYRAAVEQQGKGKNNEASEDKTKLPSTASPLPCSFIPNRTWSSRMVTHRVRHAILMALFLFPPPAPSPHSAIAVALSVSVDSFYFAMYLNICHAVTASHLCACYKQLCISVIFIFLRSDFFSLLEIDVNIQTGIHGRKG